MLHVPRRWILVTEMAGRRRLVVCSGPLILRILHGARRVR